MPAPFLHIETASAVRMLTDTLLVALVAIAAFTDSRSGRIPNRLTLGAAVAGFLVNLLLGGLGGALASIEGWFLGVGLLFAFFALGGMGGGDVKLLAAVGALKGPGFAFNAFVFTGLAGGIMAVVVLLQRRKVRYAVASVAAQLQALVYTGGMSRPDTRGPSSLRLPYGLAIAAGSVAVLFWRL